MATTLDQRLVFAEYHGRIPHAAITIAEGGGHEHWDLEWCRRDRTLYSRLSGFGWADPRVAIGGFVEKPKPGEVRIWAAPGIGFKSVALKPRSLPPGAAVALGYSFFVRRPRPFAGAVEGDTAYCGKCRDVLPTEDRCEHVGYCLDCGGDYYFDHYMKHRWHERDPSVVERRQGRLWRMAQDRLLRNEGAIEAAS